MPLGLATVAWFPTQFAGWAVIWGLVAWCGGTILLAQFGRDLGRKKEVILFQMWGGKPTTRILRHREATNTTTLMRWHRKLQELIPDVRMPTPEEEAADPGRADEVYDACGAFLRERTRDHTRFPVVFEENCNYGFRRNLWGMRPLGVATTLAGMLAVGALIVLNTQIKHVNTPPVAYVGGALNAVLLVMWGAWVTPEWVKTTANAYADRLLSSCDNL